ncbi:helix-turn-helix domain-containing protein [Silanimonas sp.]|uniref:helix-turn-helix domain-containing protein n=1 Tax=Silanimonas sp. TaxID=1929290 RepID=UPI0022C718EB|nr:helix-turn-helix domain-containing protein [Silanimonas sp.]MCZ8167289.1 helix-turn-helix domain-containing protein [Silanimonas sp.]
MSAAVAQTSSRQDPAVLAGPAPATPAQFLNWLHGDLRHRIYVVSRVEREDDPGALVFRDHTIRRDDLQFQLSCPDVWLESPDTYVMIHETRRQRLASDVVCLKAFVVDLDCHGVDDPSPEAALEQALARLDAAGLPRPHLCVETGRGVQLIWRVGRVGLRKSHRNAQVRWAKTQHALARICGPQADTSLVDLPRVIRLPGTLNSKAAAERRLTRSSWVPGASPRDYCFDELCDAALGVARRDFVARYLPKQPANDQPAAGAQGASGTLSEPRPARKPRKAAGAKGATAGFESLATIAAARLRDLDKIAQRFFLAGIPEGFRDHFIMAVATDMAWATPLQQADAFGDLVIQRLRLMGAVVDERTTGACRGRINAALSVTEARRSLGSVVQRFRDAAAGAKVEFAGQLRDPRYWYGTERKWALLGPMISSDHELLDQLEELLPRHLRQARPKPEQGTDPQAKGALAARDRVAEGRYKRARPTLSHREQALAALDGGVDVKEAASLVGVSTRTIYNWLARRSGEDAVEAAQSTPPADVPATDFLAPEPPAGQGADAAAVVKKRPFPYMASPGVLQAPPAASQVPGAGVPGSGQSQSLVGQPECGQPAGLSITEGVSAGGGQPQDRLAGHPQACPVDGGVVHAREDRGAAGAEGGGAGEGDGPGRAQPIQAKGRVQDAPVYLASRGAVAAPSAPSIGAVLSAMARAGRLPWRGGPSKEPAASADGSPA